MPQACLLRGQITMSERHPVIGVTGTFGAGMRNVRIAFHHLMQRLELNALHVEGSSYYRYTRDEMTPRIDASARDHGHFGHFSLEANRLDLLEEGLRLYGETGRMMQRHYAETEADAQRLGVPPGQFTPWVMAGEGSDLLFFEGMHGGVKTAEFDIAGQSDLLIGIVPSVNLEWIEKVHRDTSDRRQTVEDATRTILRRMPDYVNVITPQFSQTDINFQRIPLVDTSNPFIARDVPDHEECMVVIRFKNPKALGVDFKRLQALLKNSFMSRYNTIVVPGGKMVFAMELVMQPILERMIRQSRALA